ncbi:MAG: potassium/proton antiporter [Hyphomicrobiales bacterium]
MASITIINLFMLFVTALLILGILSSLVAARFGAPLLLVFLIVGMVVGEEGPGQVAFNDYRLTYLIGTISLAIILFDGGLRTRLESFRGVLIPSVLLSTVGVAVTAGLTGFLAMYVLGLSMLEGLLVGAMVASTDAAAVFFLLRTGGLQLRTRVQSTLEIESATNDPAAIFLTLLLVQLVTTPKLNAGVESLLLLLEQGVMGAAIGLLGGFLLATALNRLDLPSGLHPLFVVCSALALFSIASLLGGSGFLGVYLAGLVLGNRPVRAAPAIISFHDTATWLCQISMFIVLGLLVTPTKLIPYLAQALVIAAFLMLIARPVAVALCLAPFRFTVPEQSFVAWVGLRGAVSIFLAAIPTLAEVPNAEVYFNVVFVVVFASLLIQGWTINSLAKWLNVALPRERKQVNRVEIDIPGQLSQEMVGYPVTASSPVLDDAAVPDWAQPVIVVRNDDILSSVSAGALRPGDFAYFVAPPERAEVLDTLFAPGTVQTQQRQGLQLPVRTDVRVSYLADMYGGTVEEDRRDETVSDFFNRVFDGRPNSGDRVELGDVTLIARSVEENRVTEAGILLTVKPREQAADTSAAGGPSKPVARESRSLLSRIAGGARGLTNWLRGKRH